MGRVRRGIGAVALYGCLLPLMAVSPDAGAQTAPGRLDEVLRQMDAASAKFRSATADFKWDFYQRVVRETSTQEGTIFFQKDGSATEMGARIDPPQAKTVSYKGGVLRLFDPGADHLTEVNAGANQTQYESFLTLGFGGSGKDLERVWTVTDMGTEPISDGTTTVQTEKLDLVAKDANTRKNNFTHVLIWVDPMRAISLKQQFFTPSEDVRTAVYTHIRYNQAVEHGKFAIKTDKKTTVDRR